MVRFRIQFEADSEFMFRALARILPIDNVAIEELEPPKHVKVSPKEALAIAHAENKRSKKAKRDRYRKAANAYWASPKGQARRKRMIEDAQAPTDQA